MTWSSRLAHTRCVCFCRCSMLLVLEYTLNSIQLQRENVSLKSDQKCSQAISYDDGRVLLLAAILFIVRISFCFPISLVYGAHKAKSRAREGVAFFCRKKSHSAAGGKLLLSTAEKYLNGGHSFSPRLSGIAAVLLLLRLIFFTP